MHDVDSIMAGKFPAACGVPLVSLEPDFFQYPAPWGGVLYWVPKIGANRERDARKEQALTDQGWRVFTVWECQLRRDSIATTTDELSVQPRCT